MKSGWSDLREEIFFPGCKVIIIRYFVIMEQCYDQWGLRNDFKAHKWNHIGTKCDQRKANGAHKKNKKEFGRKHNIEP